MTQVWSPECPGLCYSERDLSGKSIICPLVRKAGSQAPPQKSWIRICISARSPAWMLEFDEHLSEFSLTTEQHGYQTLVSFRIIESFIQKWKFLVPTPEIGFRKSDRPWISLFLGLCPGLVLSSGSVLKVELLQSYLLITILLIVFCPSVSALKILFNGGFRISMQKGLYSIYVKGTIGILGCITIWFKGGGWSCFCLTLYIRLRKHQLPVLRNQR